MTKNEVIEVLKDMAFECDGIDGEVLLLDTVLKYVEKVDEVKITNPPPTLPYTTPNTIRFVEDWRYLPTRTNDHNWWYDWYCTNSSTASNNTDTK